MSMGIVILTTCYPIECMVGIFVMTCGCKVSNQVVDMMLVEQMRHREK